KYLAWVLEHKDWDAEEFEGVIRSDECSVEKSPMGSHRKDKLHMVWSCFWGSYRGPLVPLPQRSITALVYRCILYKYLLPIICKINSTIRESVFQQDNANIHTAGVMIRFFEWYNIQIANHPPYSPDLNPIEHAWVLLKKQLLIDYPNIGEISGGPDAVKAKLAEVLA
ncbi:hypothetical protein K440DRAFT_476045, partial [Wilcoxina mikolae CBS 423.85]